MLTRTIHVRHPCCSTHREAERQRARFSKLLSPVITQQSENNSVPARDLPLEREIIQEPSGITAPSLQGHGARRELPQPHDSMRFSHGPVRFLFSTTLPSAASF